MVLKNPHGINISFARPRHPHLETKRSQYYLMNVDASERDFQFVNYPHYLTALNIFKNATVQILPAEYVVREDTGESDKMVISCVRTSFKRARLCGKCLVDGSRGRNPGFFVYVIIDPETMKGYAMMTNSDDAGDLFSEILRGATHLFD